MDSAVKTKMETLERWMLNEAMIGRNLFARVKLVCEGTEIDL